MTKTRVPTQKRSIEKREKIVKAGFDLFCEKGYYKTNTAEIAKYAGVSTGALYSYFEDKRQIFIESFHQHLDAISSALLQQLTSLPEQLDLSTFIKKWIEVYIDLYAKSNHALVQLRLVIVDDEEINHHFSALENTYFSNIANILETLGQEIKRRRRAKGWTQEHLAQLVDLTPCSIMYIENRSQHTSLNAFYKHLLLLPFHLLCLYLQTLPLPQLCRFPFLPKKPFRNL